MNKDKDKYVYDTWEVLGIFKQTKDRENLAFISRDTNDCVYTLSCSNSHDLVVSASDRESKYDVELFEYWDLEWAKVEEPVSFLKVLAIGTWFSASHPLLTKKLGTESDEYLPVDFFIELSYFSSKDRLDIMTKGQFYIIDRES